MEKCKFCGQELPEGQTLCPDCGRDNAEMPEEKAAETVTEQPKKATPGRIALAVAAVVVLIGVLAALIAAGVKGQKVQEVPTEPAATGETQETTVPATIPPDGNPDDVTCKGSYTVADEEVPAGKNTVVATIGDAKLTNAQLQIQYWSAVSSFLNSQQGNYIMMYGGFDYRLPLDVQKCAVEEGITWQQFFLRQALNNWQTSQALYAEAQKAGMELTEEEQTFLENIEPYLETTAGGYGLTVEELLARNVGPGIDVADFVTFQTNYTKGSGYYNQKVSALVPTEEDLRAFYEEHAEAYTEGGLQEDASFVDVRHILVAVQGGSTNEEGDTVYTDEEWKTCEDAAQAILDQWLAGEKTEESFAALANEKSEDPGSNTTGGLYENISMGQMVKPFEEWCFDGSRVYGDYGLVKTSYGYHIMFFVKSVPQWQFYSRQDWLIEKTNEFIDELAEGYPMEVDYAKIALGLVEIG